MNINEQIEEFKNKLEPFKNLADLREFSTLSQKNIKKIEIGIKEKKFKKYIKTKNYNDKKWNKIQSNDEPEPNKRELEHIKTKHFLTRQNQS